MNNIDTDDLGIDVVYISNDTEDSESEPTEAIEIKLFNFKYRAQFKSGNGKGDTELSRSTKFLEFIAQGETLDTKKNTLVHTTINRIIEKLNSKALCNFTLYVVSNEEGGFPEQSSEYIKALKSNYELEIIKISLDDIVGFYSQKKNNYKCKLILKDKDFFPFEVDSKATSKSYVFKLSLFDLIRITCNDAELCLNFSFNNLEEIGQCHLDQSFLFDNVRGFLGDTKYNKNIISTLKRENENFFMYNNGITITATDIESDTMGMAKQYLFTISDYQIVNGGQTLRSIYKFLEFKGKGFEYSKLQNSFVLVRIFKISQNADLKNYIAEYSNSQNAITEIDLKSVDPLQIQIEDYFRERNVYYSRKAGDIGDISKEYLFRIPMEKLAQILYSEMGEPQKASSAKKRLFKDYYSRIFNTDNFSMEHAFFLACKYNEIVSTYKQKHSEVTYSDQKMFFIIYILSRSKLSIDSAILELERFLDAYVHTDPQISKARKLLLKGFRDFVDEQLS